MNSGSIGGKCRVLNPPILVPKAFLKKLHNVFNLRQLSFVEEADYTGQMLKADFPDSPHFILRERVEGSKD